MQPEILIAGPLRREYIFPAVGNPHLDIPGGLLYAASGARLWSDSVSLLSRAGEDFPSAWLKQFQAHGIDTSGIRVVHGSLDLRALYAYNATGILQRTSPVSHFASRKMPFPKALLGYSPAEQDELDPTERAHSSPQISDSLSVLLSARGAHLCPMDLKTHQQLSLALYQGRVPTVTVDPSASYMKPFFYEDIRAMLKGLTAFLPNEEELRALFWGKTTDLWEMCAELAQETCEFIIVKRGGRGQMVYDAATGNGWEVSAYPAQMHDPTGVGDAYAGGWIAGYRHFFDPLQAALCGGASASLALEGSGPFYCLTSMPGLVQARMQSLQGMTKKR